MKKWIIAAAAGLASIGAVVAGIVLRHKNQIGF